MLFRADCLDLLTNIKSNTVTLAFLDPPFNLGKSYDSSKRSDQIATEIYRGWCRTWLLETIRVLKPGGSLFLYHWPRWLMDFGAWLNTVESVEYKAWIALKMKNGFPMKKRLQPAHYGLLYYVKRGGLPRFNVVKYKSPTCRHCGKLIHDYGGYRDRFKPYEDNDGIPWIGLSDFWEDTRPARHDKARKVKVNELPTHIPERVILLTTEPGDVVLDCFSGGGSTLQAALMHDRLWIGGDIGTSKSSLRRIATFFGTEETSPSSRKLLGCFQKPFRDALNQLEIRKKRPILNVRKLTNIKSLRNGEAKSRVFHLSKGNNSSDRKS